MMLILGSVILLGLTCWAYVRRKQKNEKSEITKLQSYGRKLFDENQPESRKDEKRCVKCNRLLSENTVNDVCRSCENDKLSR